MAGSGSNQTGAASLSSRINGLSSREYFMRILLSSPAKNILQLSFELFLHICWKATRAMAPLFPLWSCTKKCLGAIAKLVVSLYFFLSKLFSRNYPGLRGHKSKPIPAISKRLMPEINWANLIPWRAIYQALYTIIYYKLCRNKDNSTKKKTLVL